MRERNAAHKKLVATRAKAKVINEKKDRLGRLLAELEKGLKSANYGVEVPMIQRGGENLKPDIATGVWIAGCKEKEQIVLYKFADLVNGEQNPLKLKIAYKGPMVGSDGKEVTFNHGDLLSCQYLGDTDEGIGFHFANVIPENEATTQQYAIAMARLFGKPVPTVKEEFLIVDGVFRTKGE